MANNSFTSGTIFVSWWANKAQNFSFIKFGPKHSALNAETLRIAHEEVAADPTWAVELWLCTGILVGLRQNDDSFSCRHAAALAQHTGWRFFVIQEMPNTECFIGLMPAKNQREFRSLVYANLRPTLDPLGALEAHYALNSTQTK